MEIHNVRKSIHQVDSGDGALWVAENAYLGGHRATDSQAYWTGNGNMRNQIQQSLYSHFVPPPFYVTESLQQYSSSGDLRAR